ncbi:MAG: DUF1588 domain-containing protein [Myxococcales bacterium FL481]|nr:MAG: DUF1588 domain-containing protein [Myxococcales bacterium FL481]
MTISEQTHNLLVPVARWMRRLHTAGNAMTPRRQPAVRIAAGRRTRTIAPLLGLSLALVACSEDEPTECVSTRSYFEQDVWAQTLADDCLGCHTKSGAAKESNFVLVSPEENSDYLNVNYATFAKMAKLEYDGTSVLLLKPTGNEEHGGGVRFDEGSEPYNAFVRMIEQVDSPVECANEPDAAASFDGLEVSDEVATLRKATLTLAGRLPTPHEELRVELSGEPALDTVLDGIMREEAFYGWIKEVYNDKILTDRYFPRTDALDLLDEERYPNRYWFDAIADDNERDLAAQRANQAVAREVLELIAFVVREGRPFTEIVTADYMMFNPYSAKSYGVNIAFDNDADPNEFRPGQRAGLPHAGALTSHMFLNRFPTTDTNRNRHRARIILDVFLGMDVLRLASRPLDPSSIKEFNPTLNSSECTVCHEVIDPIAGTLQNWTDTGRYNPPEEGWHGDMLPPGFSSTDMPYAQKDRGATWLAQQLVTDGRFPIAVVRAMLAALTGSEALIEPRDPDAADYVARTNAARAQTKVLETIAQGFVDHNYDLRFVIRELVKTPYFRAVNIETSVDDEEKLAELSQLGSPNFLTPEQLHRRIEAVTGYPWRDRVDDEGFLLEFNEYRIFYGGIDSDTIVDRIREPNGIMANVAARMANEVACWTTAVDFVSPPAQRRLFPFVSLIHEPQDANGFEVPAAADAIRANIRYLHQRVLGEVLEPDDPEIDRTYHLFLEVWRDGKQGMADEIYSDRLPSSCAARRDLNTGEELPPAQRIDRDERYTIRAWMAVMSYLLADYRFLHL